MKRVRAVSWEDNINSLCRDLQTNGVAKRKPNDRAYLKMPETIQNYGTPTPTITALVKKWAAEYTPNTEELCEVARLLWDTEPIVYEHRQAVVKLLRLKMGILTAQQIPLVESFLGDSFSWALVDEMAVHVAAHVVSQLESTEERQLVLQRLVTHENFWLRRSCLLVHLNGDLDDFVTYATPLLVEKEFFIQKAIGWVLRQHRFVREGVVCI
jgi:3-methyladenine DNA glycosylase AlkD